MSICLSSICLSIRLSTFFQIEKAPSVFIQSFGYLAWMSSSVNQINSVLLKEQVRIPRTCRAGGTAMLWGVLPLDVVGSCRLFFTDDLQDTLSWVPVWDDILTPIYIDPRVNISYDILTPGSIYRNDILTPLTIFWPPLPIVYKTVFASYQGSHAVLISWKSPYFWSWVLRSWKSP